MFSEQPYHSYEDNDYETNATISEIPHVPPKKLIQFRQSIESLSVDEYNQCIAQFMENYAHKFRKQDLLRFIFIGLAQQMDLNQYNAIDAMNDIISDIQTARDKNVNRCNCDASATFSCQNISELHVNAIASICVYLNESEQVNLALTNRSLFLDVSSVMRNIKIMPKYLSNRQDSFSKRYSTMQSIRDMQIAFDTPSELDTSINILSEFQDKDFACIQTMRIHSHCDWDDLPMDSLLQFVINQLCNMNQFEYILYFRNASTHFSSYEWMRKLTALSIGSNCYRMDKEWDQSLQNMSLIMNNVYRCISNKLRSLHIGFEPFSDDIHGKLVNLEELCLPMDSYEHNLQLLIQQNMIHLRRVHFNYNNHKPIEETGVDINLLQAFMNKIMKTVHYIGINIEHGLNHQRIDEILDIVMNALEQQERSAELPLKIRFNQFYLSKQVGVLVEKLKSLIVKMSVVSNNWMVICEDIRVLQPKKEQTKQIHAMNKLLDDLKQLTDPKYSITIDSKPVHPQDLNIAISMKQDRLYFEQLLISLEKDYKVPFVEVWEVGCWFSYRFVVASKQCNINGYLEPWIMYCNDHMSCFELRCKQNCITNPRSNYGDKRISRLNVSAI